MYGFVLPKKSKVELKDKSEMIFGNCDSRVDRWFTHGYVVHSTGVEPDNKYQLPCCDL